MKFSLVRDWLTDLLHDQFKQFSNRSGYALWAAGLSLFCLSLLSWKLLLAIALGILVAWGVFESQQPERLWLTRSRKTLQQFWRTSTGKAVISGSGTTFVMLLGFALTDATGRGWIAATLILQALLSCGVWGIWRQGRPPQTLSPRPDKTLDCDRYIHDLAHPALMRRLIAVRRLHHVMLTQRLSRQELRELQDYFQILLSQESDPVLRLALQDTLETCDRLRPTPTITSSAVDPFAPQTVQVRHVRPSAMMETSLS